MFFLYPYYLLYIYLTYIAPVISYLKLVEYTSMEEFYVYLSSLGSAIEHSNNTPSRFTNEMRPPITLSGNWSVGLQNIICDKNLNNIYVEKESSDYEISFVAQKKLYSEDNVKKFREGKDITYAIASVKSIKYTPTYNIYADNISDLIVKLEKDFRTLLYNESIINSTDLSIFEYSAIKDRIIINNLGDLFEESTDGFIEITMHFGVKLCELIGESKGFSITIGPSQGYTCTAPPKKSNSVDCIYIYSDIIKRSRTADGETHILDVLPLKTKYSKDNSSIIYKHVKSSILTSISIDMRDQNGREIYYKDGVSTTCILHFKQV